MSTINWPTLVVAIIGATTGVLSLGWNVYTKVSDRPRLRLNFQIGYADLQDGEGFYVFLEAVNTGRYPITINSVGFDLSNRMQLIMPFNRNQRPPFEVLPGRAYQAWLKREKVQRELARQGKEVRIIAAWANDMTGKRWRRKAEREWNGAVEPEAASSKEQPAR